jgi:hypothetical protein
VGFTPPRRIYVLDFADTELEGLEVRARSMSVGALLDTGEGLDAIANMPDLAELEKLPQAEQARRAVPLMRRSTALYEVFAEHLVSWNYEDEHGQPVPATLDGLRTLDQAHAQAIIGAWRRAVSAVPPDSAPTSNGGKPSEVPPLPMEVTSASLAS